MQRTRTFDRKRIVYFIVIPVIVIIALIAFDQITKYFVEKNKTNTTVINKIGRAHV